jgi:SAM-dependent methyltransferase
MFTTVPSPRQLFDETARRWVRKRPALLYDFTGLVPLLDMAQPVSGLRVLDVGCGDGYCARGLKQKGAGHVVGVDLSPGMLRLAREQEAAEPLGIEYREGCASDLSAFADGSFQMTIAAFLLNYLTMEQTRRCMQEVARVLTPGGRFLFVVPHPAFPFVRHAAPPFYFAINGAGYFSGRDHQFSGRLWKRDTTWLEVQLRHKTVEDYFDALAWGGFRAMPRVRELRVTPDLVDLDPAFFGPVVDTPLHMAVEVVR